MFLFRRIWTTASESSRVEAFLELHGAHGNVQNWYVETGEHILIKSYTPIKSSSSCNSPFGMVNKYIQIPSNSQHLLHPSEPINATTKVLGVSCSLKNPRWNLHDAQNAHKKDGIGWEGWNLRTSKPFWASNS